MKRLLSSLLLLGALSGCNLLGESSEALAARREADGRAIGGACRHAGRAIEDCYVLNKKSDRAAVFAGWREMNDYMRDNQLQAVAPQFSNPPDVGAKAEPQPAEGARPAHVDAKAKKES
jgi:hypothetical protein